MKGVEGGTNDTGNSWMNRRGEAVISSHLREENETGSCAQSRAKWVRGASVG